ncbi:MAG: bifunctional DNA primase/helicase, partial [Cyanobacteria bacterium J06633_8]
LRASAVEKASSTEKNLTPNVRYQISQEYATLSDGVSVVPADGKVSEDGEAISSSAPPASPAPPAPKKSPLRIWSIHSDNSGSKENVAFIKDITNSITDVDALLASPSLGTGVDIPNYHFDVVYGAFHGVSQTATECAQQLYRYRPKVPFHVWVAPRPPFGYKDTNAKKIKERLLQTNELTAFLIRIDRKTGKRGAEKDWALEAYCQIEAKRNQSMNNLRTDLRELLTEMGNQIIPMGAEDDFETAERLKDAAAALDVAYNTGVAKARDISASEYRSYRSKDYLNPEEMLECEKFRIKEAYGMEITEELVAIDDKGKLIKSIINLEAILSETDGVITDERTGRQHPAPPKIVTEKDHAERLHYPLCMDWGNYSAKWQARFFLGLHKILKRLINGERITAKDPELLRMTKLAEQMSKHIKAILGFTVPADCEPIWLLEWLVRQLGLKLINDKPGARGKQVKHHFLEEEKLQFALLVIKHRQLKRKRKEERARQEAEDQRRYQAGREAQYGISPPPDPVSTPPPNGIGNSPLGGVDTTRNNGVNLEKIDNSSPIYEVSGDLEPNDGDSTPIQTSLQMLREAIVGGVEAVKATICSWTSERRWCAVLLLEEVAEGELRNLEQMIPSFYAWLGEES